MAATPSLEDLLLDLVRLMPDDERVAILQGAELRQRMLSLAERMGVQPAAHAVRAAAVSFRDARGLRRSDDLSAWCADRGVDPAGFARLMLDEARLRAFGAGAARAQATEVADFLRVADGAERAWTRARTLRDGAAGDDASRDERLHAWYESALGRPVPDDVDSDARARGFDDADDLARALARTASRRHEGALASVSVGDPLPDFVLRHEGFGDVRPDLFAGRWWSLVLARGHGAAALDAIEGLGALGGLVVGAARSDDAAWVALDDPTDQLGARLRLTATGCHALLIDPAGRVADVAVVGADDFARRFVERAASPAPRVELAGGAAPVLVVPGAFEPSFCERLIEAWASGEREAGRVTALGDAGAAALRDEGIKRRVDHVIADGALEREVLGRLARRVFPAVKRAFQFVPGRCEGFRVGCYEAAEGGFFRAHRDDSNPATAHRRFALSVNLTHGRYEGGRLVLPEYGAAFDAPTGAAVVYSAALLHEVTPVTAGRRFALVGFFSGASR